MYDGPMTAVASPRVAPGTKKAEQSEATRGTLLKVSRRLFTRHGYNGTSIEAITRGAKITRGALYHHFESKQDLFRAVFEEIERELAEQIGAAALDQPDATHVLDAGYNAFLDACLEPSIQQIVLLDAPSVLGYETWHDIDAQYGLGLVTAALEAGMDAGQLERQPATPLAVLILGALNEGGLYIARSDDVAKARREIGAAMDRLLRGWQVQPKGGVRKRSRARS